MHKLISVNNFSKSFSTPSGKKNVIDDLSFDVEPGEVFAFLGANGSGKTTTIRSLLRIYQPDSGELLINGKVYDQSQSDKLGYLPEERGLYSTSRVLETLIYFGQIKSLSYEVARKQALEYLEKVDLLDKQNTVINKLSSGQQQKIQLGITIINHPQILILDEPTKGLDPVNRTLLMDILLELKEEGSTILFSSHQMDEVERIADRLLMIKDGKRMLYGSLSEVKESFGNSTLKIYFSGNFPKESNLYSASVENRFAEVVPNTGVGKQQILKFLIDSGLEIESFSMTAPSLNEIFISVSKIHA